MAQAAAELQRAAADEAQARAEAAESACAACATASASKAAADNDTIEGLRGELSAALRTRSAAYAAVRKQREETASAKAAADAASLRIAGMESQLSALRVAAAGSQAAAEAAMAASTSRLADVQAALASAQEAAASSAAESAAAQAHIFTLESELKNTATRLFAAEAALGAAAAENSEHVRVAGHSAHLKTMSFNDAVVCLVHAGAIDVHLGTGRVIRAHRAAPQVGVVVHNDSTFLQKAVHQ